LAPCAFVHDLLIELEWKERNRSSPVITGFFMTKCQASPSRGEASMAASFAWVFGGAEQRRLFLLVYI
jgi:hypothetical protein